MPQDGTPRPARWRLEREALEDGLAWLQPAVAHDPAYARARINLDEIHRRLPAHPRHYRMIRRRSAHHPICRPSSRCIANRNLRPGEPPEGQLQCHMQLSPDHLPDAIKLELAKDVADSRARKAIARQIAIAPGKPARSKYRNAFIAARVSVLCNRRPGRADGISGASRTPSTSRRSLGQPLPSRRQIRRCSSVRVAVCLAVSSVAESSGHSPRCRKLLGQAPRRSAWGPLDHSQAGGLHRSPALSKSAGNQGDGGWLASGISHS